VRRFDPDLGDQQPLDREVRIGSRWSYCPDLLGGSDACRSPACRSPACAGRHRFWQALGNGT
jgi:hypothetical protein